jgi:2-polyprenyl-3-methyl-5-hydroxy-6-metoxy-1,4-benzoquinol methylase
MTTTTSDAAAIRTEPCPQCIVCGQPGLPLYEGLTDYLSGTPGRWRMVRCADPACGMLWLDPKPLAEDLIKAYATYHTHGAARARNLSRIWLSAVNSACKQACHLVELGNALGRQRRELRTMFIGNARPGRLLEVGSGSGRFLNRMRNAGWQVEGIDFDPVAAARVEERFGIAVAVGSLPELGYPEGQYDVVAMSQVIEHVPDPVLLLRECRRVLRAGGRLVLSTPNARSVAHRAYGRHWRGLEPPRHQHVFSPSALERCAGDCGFRELRRFTLSAESAGIYRASEELRRVQDGGGSATSMVLRSWILRHREFQETLRDPDAGQDLFLIATK